MKLYIFMLVLVLSCYSYAENLDLFNNTKKYTSKWTEAISSHEIEAFKVYKQDDNKILIGSEDKFTFRGVSCKDFARIEILKDSDSFNVIAGTGIHLDSTCESSSHPSSPFAGTLKFNTKKLASSDELSRSVSIVKKSNTKVTALVFGYDEQINKSLKEFGSTEGSFIGINDVPQEGNPYLGFLITESKKILGYSLPAYSESNIEIGKFDAVKDRLTGFEVPAGKSIPYLKYFCRAIGLSESNKVKVCRLAKDFEVNKSIIIPSGSSLYFDEKKQGDSFDHLAFFQVDKEKIIDRKLVNPRERIVIERNGSMRQATKEEIIKILPAEENSF